MNRLWCVLVCFTLLLLISEGLGVACSTKEIKQKEKALMKLFREHAQKVAHIFQNEKNSLQKLAMKTLQQENKKCCKDGEKELKAYYLKLSSDIDGTTEPEPNWTALLETKLVAISASVGDCLLSSQNQLLAEGQQWQGPLTEEKTEFDALLAALAALDCNDGGQILAYAGEIEGQFLDFADGKHEEFENFVGALVQKLQKKSASCIDGLWAIVEDFAANLAEKYGSLHADGPGPVTPCCHFPPPAIPGIGAWVCCATPPVTMSGGTGEGGAVWGWVVGGAIPPIEPCPGNVVDCCNDCGPPPSIPNSTSEGDCATACGGCTYTCNPGYTYNPSSPTLRTQHAYCDGTVWTPVQSCVPVPSK